jgi:hypothetical protein
MKKQTDIVELNGLLKADGKIADQVGQTPVKGNGFRNLQKGAVLLQSKLDRIDNTWL